MSGADLVERHQAGGQEACSPVSSLLALIRQAILLLLASVFLSDQ